MSLKIKLLVTLILAFGLASAANATTVEFNGVTADLTIVGSTDNGDGTTTYTVVYTFDFSGWDPSFCDSAAADSCGAENATHLGAIDFSFGGPENPYAVLNVSMTTAPGDWTLFDVVANGNGCNGGGHNSVCAQVDPLHSVAISGTYQWVFEVTYSNDYVPSDEDAAVRAWFVQCAGEYECRNAGLMSLRTNVPEPGTLGMLGVGLVLLGITRRRRTISTNPR